MTFRSSFVRVDEESPAGAYEGITVEFHRIGGLDLKENGRVGPEQFLAGSHL
jgi:hypothetical protein